MGEIKIYKLEDEIKEEAKLFKIFAHPGRLRILEILLTEGEITRSKISEETKLYKSGAQEQIKILKDAGIIERDLKGYRHIYKIEIKRLEEIKKSINNALTRSKI